MLCLNPLSKYTKLRLTNSLGICHHSQLNTASAVDSWFPCSLTNIFIGCMFQGLATRGTTQFHQWHYSDAFVMSLIPIRGFQLLLDSHIFVVLLQARLQSCKPFNQPSDMHNTQHLHECKLRNTFTLPPQPTQTFQLNLIVS